MSQDYETIRDQLDVKRGDRIRVTVEGTVKSVDGNNPGVTYDPMWGGVVIQTDSGSLHELYLATASVDPDVNAVKRIEDPEIAPGQTWRGGDARFVTIGNESDGYVFHHVTTGQSHRPNEFFSRYRHNYELLQEPV